MTETLHNSMRSRIEESSFQPLAQIETAYKKPLAHFEESSLTSSSKKVEFSPLKPQLSSSLSPSISYQVLLVKCAEKLDKLQTRILKFDTEQIRQSHDKAKAISSRLSKVNSIMRQRQVNADKWQTIAKITSVGLMCSSLISFGVPIGIGTIFSATLVSLAPIASGLKVTLTSQQLLNDAYLLQTKAEKTRLDHEFQKEVEKQSQLAQVTGNNAFRELEEQIRYLAIALDKQTINF